MSQPPPNIRNIAIIAHVDHGKTTLVDGMLRQTNVFRENQQVVERILDSNDLEQERGITILAKNTGIIYNDVTINIVDTPGHADFGGEVERIMNMVDGVLLLVDAVEGPMPQTRFVLQNALAAGHNVILVVNKIDRPTARPDFVVDAMFDLFIDLGANDEQADFPVLYSNALNAQIGFSPDALATNLRPLFDTIIEHIPPPAVDLTGPTQLLVSTLEYSSYVGKIAIGRLNSGIIRAGQAIAQIDASGQLTRGKVAEVYIFRDLKRVSQPEVYAGNIVAVAGVPDVGIGDTLTDPENPTPLPPITIEKPTVRMTFCVNDSPFSGRDGRFVTSRQIRERLWRELESNVAMRIEETDSASDFIISGRGELHLAIFIETMRREGYEFAVSKPEVIFRKSVKGLLEPIEKVFVQVPNDYVGAVSEMLGKRHGCLADMRYGEDGTVDSTYHVPIRGMLGFRQPFLTATRGTGIYQTLFHGYEPFTGEIETQDHGSLIALETGRATGYALMHLQQRGTFFIRPGDEVYAGQVIGQHIRDEDLVINVCKTKHATGHRATPQAMEEGLSMPRTLSLDETIEYLDGDELLEVTPHSLRIRKKELNHNQRRRATKQSKRLG